MNTVALRQWHVDEIDLANDGFYGLSFDDRDEAYRVLRRERPVAHFAERAEPPFEAGPGFWALTRHADVVEASRSADVYSSAEGTLIRDRPSIDIATVLHSMFDMDDPGHAKRRKLVADFFTARAVSGFAATVERLVDEILDDVVERGECDLANDVAKRLPVAVTCDLMGVPPLDRAWIQQRTTVVSAYGDPSVLPGQSLPVMQALNNANELGQYGVELAKHRRKAPTDDMMSRLAHAQIDGRRLTDDELAQWFLLFQSAGSETTGHAITKGVAAFDAFPEQRAAWMADFDGLAPTAIEEILRWSSPVIQFRRTLTRDIVLHDQELHAGDKIVLVYSAANRDEDAFEHPYRFDIRRKKNHHVAFGGAGPHNCLGAPIARRELRVMMRAIFERLPDLELAAEPTVLRSTIVSGIREMPVLFTPTARKGN
jgi:cytochrome P450